MLLCDIGNTSFHFFDGKKSYKKNVATFDPTQVKEKVYFICVNIEVLKTLKTLPNWIDLAKNIDKTDFYETMGVDRIVATLSIQNGVVVDAGSALTVDVVRDGIFCGGFIYPGINAMKQCFTNISPALDYELDLQLNLQNIPKNSKDSLNYGYLKGLVLEITSYNLPIILTGGDALKFKHIFKNATIDDMLIFKGMQILAKF